MITGYFISVEVPEVAVGQDIKATIDFFALNPGALYWSTFLVVDSPGLGLKRLLDKAKELGQEGGREKTYNLGKMPDKEVAISFFIFAHDDAGYDWDWGEYQDWLNGFATNLTHLGSEFRLIGPGEEPPEPPEPPGPVVLSGLITRVEPSQFEVGKPIDLEIDFNAYMESLYYQIRGWETSLQAVVDGLSDSDAQTYYGRDGSRTGETLHLGAMPDRTLTGTLTLYGRGTAFPRLDWKTLDTKDLVITASEGPPEPPPVPPDEGIFSGEIISVSPLEQRIGDEIALTVKYKVSTSSLLESINGWWAEALVDVDSMSGKAESGMLTGEGPETLTQQISFGTMPEGTLYGTVNIVCHKGGFSGYSEVVATKNITLTPSGVPPVPPPPDGNGEPPIACSVDADCPEGYVCKDGVCVKKKWWETDWLVPAAIVAAVVLLLPGKKGKRGK